mmetsp:Transcript_18891/g.33557  ORF Transcript_18891/g.33557 Transcript_18891/m.33557 type:complete len:88 (+) Transcript_18891:1388-1651(+)
MSEALQASRHQTPSTEMFSPINKDSLWPLLKLGQTRGHNFSTSTFRDLPHVETHHIDTHGVEEGDKALEVLQVGLRELPGRLVAASQ